MMLWPRLVLTLCAAPGGCWIPLGNGLLIVAAGETKLLFVATKLFVKLKPGCCGWITPYT